MCAAYAAASATTAAFKAVQALPAVQTGLTTATTDGRSSSGGCVQHHVAIMLCQGELLSLPNAAEIMQYNITALSATILSRYHLGPRIYVHPVKHRFPGPRPSLSHPIKYITDQFY